MREPERVDLPGLLVVLAPRGESLRMRHDILRVLRRAVRVDGSDDRTDESDREVENRPLERRLADDRNSVSLANAAREETVCELVAGRCGVLPRHRLPAVVMLDEVRRRRAIRGDGVEP